MASAQQKPKKERGVRNSARRNGKAFKKPTTKGKPSYKTCLGVSVDRLIAKAGNKESLYNTIVDLYVSRRGGGRYHWSLARCEEAASNWVVRYR